MVIKASIPYYPRLSQPLAHLSPLTPVAEKMPGIASRCHPSSWAKKHQIQQVQVSAVLARVIPVLSTKKSPHRNNMFNQFNPTEITSYNFHKCPELYGKSRYLMIVWYSDSIPPKLSDSTSSAAWCEWTSPQWWDQLDRLDPNGPAIESHQNWQLK